MAFRFSLQKGVDGMNNLSSRNSLSIFTIAAIFIQLFGCGGGGGSGDGIATESLIYSGNTSAALITLDNAPTLVGNILYGGHSGSSIPTALSVTDQSIRSAGVTVQSEILHNISQHIRDSILKNNSLLPNITVGVVLDEPVPTKNPIHRIVRTLGVSKRTW